MENLHIYLKLVLIIFIYANFWFVVSVLKKRGDIADTAWGLGFVVLAWSSFVLFKNYSPLAILTNILVTIWGLRLAIHIYNRNKNKQEDYRYQAWRQEWGKWFYLRSYLQVFILQNILLFIISLTVINTNSKLATITSYSFLGILIWIVGFFFETVGDMQLANFLKNPSNKGHLIQSGLWKYTRHPNYFGEVTQWWGIWIISLSLHGAWFFVISPLLITLLILKVSGIPLLEAKMEKNPEFSEYKKRTSIFIPLPVKKLNV